MIVAGPSINCAVIRTRPPALRTLPSSTWLTPNSRATLGTSTCLPLYMKALLREDDRQRRHFAQVGDDVLGDAITEILLLRIAAHVGEGQHADGDAWHASGGADERAGKRADADEAAALTSRPGLEARAALPGSVGCVGRSLHRRDPSYEAHAHRSAGSRDQSGRARGCRDQPPRALHRAPSEIRPIAGSRRPGRQLRSRARRRSGGRIPGPARSPDPTRPTSPAPRSRRPAARRALCRFGHRKRRRRPRWSDQHPDRSPQCAGGLSIIAQDRTPVMIR